MGKMIKADYYVTIGDNQVLAFKKDNCFKIMIVPRRGYVAVFFVDRESLECLNNFVVELLEKLEKKEGEKNND